MNWVCKIRGYKTVRYMFIGKRHVQFEEIHYCDVACRSFASDRQCLFGFMLPSSLGRFYGANAFTVAHNFALAAPDTDWWLSRKYEFICDTEWHIKHRLDVTPFTADSKQEIIDHLKELKIS